MMDRIPEEAIDPLDSIETMVKKEDLQKFVLFKTHYDTYMGLQSALDEVTQRLADYAEEIDRLRSQEEDMQDDVSTLRSALHQRDLQCQRREDELFSADEKISQLECELEERLGGMAPYSRGSQGGGGITKGRGWKTSSGIDMTPVTLFSLRKGTIFDAGVGYPPTFSLMYLGHFVDGFSLEQKQVKTDLICESAERQKSKSEVSEWDIRTDFDLRQMVPFPASCVFILRTGSLTPPMEN
ncbi:unnamed protein product [Cyprideis torosa]|uniref:Uncharacterized protein n=1 Tax=Cyprideis torosa TaxID=163714 RepID=A0A7R8ZMP2_9CRUS|nr:unnamed protein product [Cyprideis torosa]CAG0884851.1 unnamed protein product [Cyprideis torosa]